MQFKIQNSEFKIISCRGCNNAKSEMSNLWIFTFYYLFTTYKADAERALPLNLQGGLSYIFLHRPKIPLGRCGQRPKPLPEAGVWGWVIIVNTATAVSSTARQEHTAPYFKNNKDRYNLFSCSRQMPKEPSLTRSIRISITRAILKLLAERETAVYLR